MGKPRPRTGEKRAVRQPLKIDRLPIEVRDAILQLRDRGKPWAEIEEISALKYSKDWASGRGGFVNWEELSPAVAALFSVRKLPKSNLQRWYDIRVSQVMAETMARSAQARELAAAFAKSVVAGEDKAVLNAARDQLMSLLAEDTTPKARAVAARGLIALAEMQQGSRANDIKERKVAVDERRLVQLEKDADLKRRRMEAETTKAAKKVQSGQFSLDDINLLRERTFGLPPLQAAAR
jgi:hypothetical protein